MYYVTIDFHVYTYILLLLSNLDFCTIAIIFVEIIVTLRYGGETSLIDVLSSKRRPYDPRKLKGPSISQPELSPRLNNVNICAPTEFNSIHFMLNSRLEMFQSTILQRCFTGPDDTQYV